VGEVFFTVYQLPATSYRLPATGCATIARFDREYKPLSTAAAEKDKRKLMAATSGSELALILTTLGADADAAALARTLVEERLAACVNVMPGMTSIYRWKGNVEQEHEQQLLIKTTSGRVEALAARLREIHPYELPEFIVLDAAASAAYGAWVKKTVG